MFRIKNIFLLLSIINLCSLARGNASNTSDSLRQLITHTTVKTIKADALASLAAEIMSVHADSAFVFARQSKELSASIGYLGGISRSANILGLIFLDMGNEAKAMEYFLLSLRISEEIRDKHGLSRSYNNIGLVLSNQKMNKKALSYYIKSLKVEEELGNNLGIAQSLNNIGLHFNDIGDYTQAISYSKRSLELYRRLGDKTGLANILNNIGIIYDNEKKYSMALDFYNQSLHIEEQLHNDIGIAKSAYNIAMIYQTLGDVAKSNSYNDYALKLAQSLENKELISNCAELKSQNLGKSGDYKTALHYLEISVAIDDSLAAAGMDQKIQAMEQAYEIEKQQSQIVFLEKDNIIQQKLADRQKLQRNLMMGGILVVALFAFFLFRSVRRSKKINALLAQRNLEIGRQQEDLAKSHLEISRQRDALKLSNIGKDKFFSIVAHDLKSPFTSMLGFSEILAEEYNTLNDAERHEIAVDIHSSIKTGYNLVENLLAWGSLQIGRIEFAPGQLVLKKEVDEVLELLHRVALQKKIGIYNEVEPCTTVEADANMLRSVLRNLISNALKYTNNGGKIRIMASASDTPGMIRVSVNDSGVGMSEDEIAKLFAPEISFSTKGTANETGTGLGLLLCSEMIARHNGKISVESEPGNGSTFSFTIPAYQKHKSNFQSIH